MRQLLNEIARMDGNLLAKELFALLCGCLVPFTIYVVG